MPTQHDPALAGNDEAALADSLGRGHEQRDVAAKPIIVFCVALVVSIVVVQWAVVLFQKLLERQEVAGNSQKVSSVAQSSIADSMTNHVRHAEPLLQPSPFHESFDREDWAALLGKWDTQLTTVGGFEMEPDRAHVPVDRVIDQAVEKGIASLKPVATTQPAGQNGTAP